jgi:hypothetical protein
MPELARLAIGSVPQIDPVQEIGLVAKDVKSYQGLTRLYFAPSLACAHSKGCLYAQCWGVVIGVEVTKPFVLCENSGSLHAHGVINRTERNRCYEC